MRVRPGLLFGGIFFILLGGLPLLVRAGVLDPDALADLWRFWPLLLVALGIALILGRTRAGLLGTVVAATALGLAVGGALAAGTQGFGNLGGCGTPDAGASQRFEQNGAFEGPATARFDLDCGSLELAVASDAGWRVQVDYQGDAPTLDATATELELQSPDGFGVRRQAWTVDLPADQLRDLQIRANAATANATLAGAELGTLDVQFNAGDVRIDGTDGSVGRVEIATNAGRLRLTLDSDATGSLRANAGALDLCAPDDATLRLRVQEQLTFGHNLDDRGLTQSGDVWTREGAVGGPVIDLSVSGNAASFSLDPDGGC
jgi:hypothetical protein